MSVKIENVKISSRSGLEKESISMRGVKGERGDKGDQGARGKPGMRGPPGKCCDIERGEIPPVRVIQKGGLRKIEKDDTVIIINTKESVSLSVSDIDDRNNVEDEDSYVHLNIITILTGKYDVLHYLELDEIFPLKHNRRYTLYRIQGVWNLCV